MLVGIVAVIGAVISSQGGFITAIGKLSELESDIPLTLGQGSICFFLWTRPT